MNNQSHIQSNHNYAKPLTTDGYLCNAMHMGRYITAAVSDMQIAAGLIVDIIRSNCTASHNLLAIHMFTTAYEPLMPIEAENAYHAYTTYIHITSNQVGKFEECIIEYGKWLEVYSVGNILNAIRYRTAYNAAMATIEEAWTNTHPF